MRCRALFFGFALAVVWSGLVSLPASADPTPTPSSSGSLTEVEALRQAKATGKPVVVSALTDERTLV